MDNLFNFSLQISHHVKKQCNYKWKLDFQKLNYCDLTFVLDGEAIYTINGIEYKLSKGDGVFIPKNSTREAVVNPDNPMMCVAFNFKFLGEQSLNLPNFFKWESHYKLKAYFKEINYEWLHQNPYYKLKCESLLSLIIYEILTLDNEKQYNQYIVNIQEYIIANLSKKLTVNQIANEFNLHPVYCGSLFKKYANTTILKYIQNMRINQAKNLLMDNDLSIGEVGEHVGLSDPYYFSKIFKSLVGISPLEYRKIYSVF